MGFDHCLSQHHTQGHLTYTLVTTSIYMCILRFVCGELAGLQMAQIVFEVFKSLIKTEIERIYVLSEPNEKRFLTLQTRLQQVHFENVVAVCSTLFNNYDIIYCLRFFHISAQIFVESRLLQMCRLLRKLKSMAMTCMLNCILSFPPIFFYTEPF